MKKTIYLFIAFSSFVNVNYSQIQTWNCIEVTNPNLPSSTINLSQTQSTFSPSNDDPDAANYPDSFPGVKHTYKVVFISLEMIMESVIILLART